MPLKKIKTDSITDDAITAAKIDDDGTGFTFGDLTVTGSSITAGTSNLSTFTLDLTVAATHNTVLAGPVTIPNVTINGNLIVHTELNVTGDLDTGANGSFNIIG